MNTIQLNIYISSKYNNSYGRFNIIVFWILSWSFFEHSKKYGIRSIKNYIWSLSGWQRRCIIILPTRCLFIIIFRIIWRNSLYLLIHSRRYTTFAIYCVLDISAICHNFYIFVLINTFKLFKRQPFTNK